jgi:peroxiredoxin family protein
MTGVTILLTRDDPPSLRAALTIASAAAALGQRGRIYLHEAAVAMLCRSMAHGADAMYRAKGLPDLAGVLEVALSMDVKIIACQTGLALGDHDAEALDPRVETGGLVGLMASLGDDRLIAL